MAQSYLISSLICGLWTFNVTVVGSVGRQKQREPSVCRCSMLDSNK